MASVQSVQIQTVW